MERQEKLHDAQHALPSPGLRRSAQALLALSALRGAAGRIVSRLPRPLRTVALGLALLPLYLAGAVWGAGADLVHAGQTASSVALTVFLGWLVFEQYRDRHDRYSRRKAAAPPRGFKCIEDGLDESDAEKTAS